MEVWKDYFTEILSSPEMFVFPTFYRLFSTKTDFKEIQRFFKNRELHVLNAIMAFYLEEDLNKVFYNLLKQLECEIPRLRNKKLSEHIFNFDTTLLSKLFL